MLTSIEAACPYCGEIIELLIDELAGEQRYVEDCQVCCRPIEVAVSLDEDGLPAVKLYTDDDA